MPEVGHILPDFSLPNQDGDTVRLSDYRGQRVVIFAFLRAGTSGCQDQALAFREGYARIRALNAVVFGLSNAPTEDLQTWKAELDLPYDLLADVHHDTLEAWDAWGVRLLGLLSLPCATRSFWVLDENGRLIAGQSGVGPRESYEKAMAALEALAPTTLHAHHLHHLHQENS